MMTSKFRPLYISNRHAMRERLKYGSNFANFNWQSRVRWIPSGYRLNKITISRQFNRLHYLACHSPKSVQKKWKMAYKNLHVKLFGSNKASVRYLNNWSCHSWL